ncbi:Gfo/Idh/MocA family oxidoreductase, partial [bacterium]|nr:Gfo/Idh/MocA family oxidoreductase [bacterium]
MGISVGIVGLGSFGSAFADLFRSHPLVDRIALCDREPDRVRRFAEQEAFQAKFDVSDAYDSLEALSASNLDAVALFTQPWLHAPQAIQAMEAGKHVYSAVPVVMLPDSDEILDWCDRIVAACRRTGMRYMLGETTVYHAETMYCRRRAAEGAFGRFVHAEGEYIHDVDSPGCRLRDVRESRLASAPGQEWIAREKQYHDRGIVGGPMHYPTHSVSGPIHVMQAHATQVCAWGTRNDTDPYFAHDFSNETALFHMSNGATCRIAELREIGHTGQETFRLFGTEGSFREGAWLDKGSRTAIAAEDMRDPLPADVEDAFRAAVGDGFLGGHGG